MDSNEVDASNLLKVEADEAIREVSFAVNSVEIASKLPCTEECVYLNLKTKENKTYCVELSVSGFRVVSEKFDSIGGDSSGSTCYYETIYQLLDSKSPEYQRSFGNALMEKLSMLQDAQSDQPS